MAQEFPVSINDSPSTGENLQKNLNVKLLKILSAFWSLYFLAFVLLKVFFMMHISNTSKMFFVVTLVLSHGLFAHGYMYDFTLPFTHKCNG